MQDEDPAGRFVLLVEGIGASFGVLLARYSALIGFLAA